MRSPLHGFEKPRQIVLNFLRERGAEFEAAVIRLDPDLPFARQQECFEAAQARVGFRIPKRVDQGGAFEVRLSPMVLGAIDQLA